MKEVDEKRGGGAELSSSPWITSQIMKVNDFIQQYEPERASLGIYALLGDLPNQPTKIRDRCKVLISVFSYQRDLSNGEPDPEVLEDMEDRGAIEEKKGALGHQIYRRNDGKEDLNGFYFAVCKGDSEPMRHGVDISRLSKVRKAWSRIRDELRQSGLLDQDTVRSYMKGHE